MRLRVQTESGSCHEVDLTTLTYRRLQLPLDPSEGFNRANLRRDGDVLKLLGPPAEPVVGEPWVLVLEPLAEAAVWTVRATTPVVAIQRFE